MSQVRLANRSVSIYQACRWAEMEIPDGYGNRKTWCPFGLIAHPDGGIEAAFRVYEDTNTAYCFACGRSWSPVSLMAEFWDCGRAEAAGKMCELAGISEPGWRDRWEELHQPAPPDTSSLGEALKTWCRRVRGPSWQAEQFDPRFAEPLGACFSVLPLVTDAGEASEWLDGCKLIMGALIRGRDGDR